MVGFEGVPAMGSSRSDAKGQKGAFWQRLFKSRGQPL